MSGHSKFANIKHKKEKNDAAKGKIFTILGREIAVAVKEGGPDPANNYKLATVITKAKAPENPSGPSRGMYTLVALLAGLFLAVAVIVLMDILNTTIRNYEDVTEVLGLPIIGRFPELKGGK